MGKQKFSIASAGNRRAFLDGIQTAIPIALGYFAVSISLGIVARNIGMTPFQGMITSALCNASAGRICRIYDDRGRGCLSGDGDRDADRECAVSSDELWR